MSYKAFFDEYRTFGVEIECYGVPRYSLLASFRLHGIPCVEVSQTNQVMSTWRLSNDGSIQGIYSVEVVSPPLSGLQGLTELGNVLGILSVAGCKVNMSCGFHVHWNCGDFTGKNVLSVLRLYSKFETVIDYLVAPSRRGNSNPHCITLRKDNDLRWISEIDPSERKRAAEVALIFERNYASRVDLYHPHRSSRYHKVNISAYNLYGTIEFRQHQGTLNAEKAVNWVVFTQQLVNKAKQVSVSKEASAKPTLGELLRTLRLGEDKHADEPAIAALVYWMKTRYADFKNQEKQGVSEEEPIGVALPVEADDIPF